jgi:hypothetical protein
MTIAKNKITSSCPSCAATLVTGAALRSRALVCSSCGAQFRTNGKWPESKTSWKAMVSFALGLISPVGLFITGIPALILGSLALGDIRRAPHTITGKRLALTGTVLGGVFTFAIFLLPIGMAYFFADKINVDLSGPRQLRANKLPPVIPVEAVVLVEPGAIWKWFHPLDGVDPEVFDAGFHRIDYDDTTWQSGKESANALGFGYGDPVEVDIGRPPNGLRHSAYFRHRFETRESYASLLLTLYCDDGVVIYLDGEEVARENMPVGSDHFDTVATNTIGREDETAVFVIEIYVAIPPGSQILAISLHNQADDSSDLGIGGITLYGVP